MKKLSKEAESRVLTALESVADAVNEGTSPNDAIVKAASEHDIPAGHINLMVSAYNTGRTGKQRMAAESPFDKAATFELADQQDIMGRLYPTNVKSAAQKRDETIVDDEYAHAPVFAQRKEAAHVAARKIDWKMVDTPPEPYAGESYTAIKKAIHSVEFDKRRFEECRREVARAKDLLTSNFEKLSNYFRTPGGVSFDDACDAVEIQHGGMGRAILNQLSRTVPQFSKEAKHNCSAIHPSSTHEQWMEDKKKKRQEKSAGLVEVQPNQAPWKWIRESIKLAADIHDKQRTLHELAQHVTKKAEDRIRPFSPRQGRSVLDLPLPTTNEKQAEAAQPADQTPRHDCNKVHPGMKHEEWKASLEKKASMAPLYGAGAGLAAGGALHYLKNKDKEEDERSSLLGDLALGGAVGLGGGVAYDAGAAGIGKGKPEPSVTTKTTHYGPDGKSTPDNKPYKKLVVPPTTGDYAGVDKDQAALLEAQGIVERDPPPDAPPAGPELIDYEGQLTEEARASGVLDTPPAASQDALARPPYGPAPEFKPSSPDLSDEEWLTEHGQHQDAQPETDPGFSVGPKAPTDPKGQYQQYVDIQNSPGVAQSSDLGPLKYEDWLKMKRYHHEKRVGPGGMMTMEYRPQDNQEFFRTDDAGNPIGDHNSQWQLPEMQKQNSVHEKQAGAASIFALSHLLKGVQSGAEAGHSAQEEAVNDYIEELDDPAHQEELKRIVVRAQLENMMANDPIISQEDPNMVTEAYNEIVQLAPRAADSPLLMRNLIRQHLAGVEGGGGIMDPRDIGANIIGNEKDLADAAKFDEKSIHAPGLAAGSRNMNQGRDALQAQEEGSLRSNLSDASKRITGVGQAAGNVIGKGVGLGKATGSKLKEMATAEGGGSIFSPGAPKGPERALQQQRWDSQSRELRDKQNR